MTSQQQKIGPLGQEKYLFPQKFGRLGQERVITGIPGCYGPNGEHIPIASRREEYIMATQGLSQSEFDEIKDIEGKFLIILNTDMKRLKRSYLQITNYINKNKASFMRHRVDVVKYREKHGWWKTSVEASKSFDRGLLKVVPLIASYIYNTLPQIESVSWHGLPNYTPKNLKELKHYLSDLKNSSAMVTLGNNPKNIIDEIDMFLTTMIFYIDEIEILKKDDDIPDELAKAMEGIGKQAPKMFIKTSSKFFDFILKQFYNVTVD